MPTCGYKWSAPSLLPRTLRVVGRKQTCALPKGHKGAHRSVANVTSPNTQEKEGKKNGS